MSHKRIVGPGSPLSWRMEHVVEKMKHGYLLCHVIGLWWLRYGGCGNASKSHRVNAGTFYGLMQREVIEPNGAGSYRLKK